MKRIICHILSYLIAATLVTPVFANDYVAMTTPLPPYSINKGLHVKGIAVDTLAVIMSLSGYPMETNDVKLMLWNHAFRKAVSGPNKILLNVPRTEETAPKFKWVGPLHVNKYVVIGRKDSQKITSLADLNSHKTGTIRNSMAEKALLESGVEKSALAPACTHIIPLKKLDTKTLDYFVHSDVSATYLMKAMRMDPKKYTVMHTYREVPLYYAFSKDTDDAFIKELNENLQKMKKPGSDGMSRFDKIVAKYLPNGVLN